MKLSLPIKPGPYIVAVSGGVDSVCLLDLLVKEKDYELIVAHFDHGIRSDSHMDAEFVRELANKYKLPFVTDEGHLGPDASEDKARDARYKFLRQSAQDHNAVAVITAHHLDDRLETLFINLIRGTGRRGLASISESSFIKRPLLKVSKSDLKLYASNHALKWREDSSNSSDKYLRNYVRHHILVKLDPETKQKLINLMDDQTRVNNQIDQIVGTELLNTDPKKLSRQVVNGLSFVEGEELISSWLRQNNLFNFDRKTIERLTLAFKTKRPGIRVDVYGGHQVTVGKEFLALQGTER